MSQEKGMMNGLIQDAISSMDIDPDSQKAVNVKTDSDTLSQERLANAQKADSSGLINSGDERGDNANKISAVPVGAGLGIDKYVKWFSDLSNKDIKVAGGKGASLGEMFNNKFPVPPGFVVTAQAFDYFMTQKGLKEKIYDIISKVDMEETEDLTRASKAIRKMIEDEEIPDDLRGEILEAYHVLGSEDLGSGVGVSQDALNILKNAQEPAFVSIRSSATTEDLADASFAGQQETFLNVKGDNAIVEHVKKCFSSLYTPRAIYYRNKKGFKEGEALLAAIVQKMVDSEKSGVVFSRDPVGSEEEVALEAVFGLGEGIVSGKIKPDHYVVSRDLKLKDVKVAKKKIAIVRTGSGQNEIVKLSEDKSKTQVLTAGEVLEIADYAVKLEDHYKKPQDIEFAVEGGEVYILQSRPITTLGKKTEGKELKGNVILEGQSASPGVGAGIVKIIKSMEDLPKIKKSDVLVTEMTNPDMVVAMQKSAAIVTDEGGMTSHAAIVSREMGIPCIVGTETATTDLKDGMRITVDGANGKVYEGEVAESQAVEIKKAVDTSRIKIKVIVDLPDFAERAAETGLDAVGLTRLEGIIASMKKHPLKYEKEGKLDEYTKVIEEGLSKILSYFKQVWFRASDVRTDEYSTLEGAPEREINPMLGFHGIRFSLKHPEILKAELEAMKQVASANPDKKIGIMFPQVISIEEVKKAKKYFNEFKLDNMEFGVMIETPASVQIIDSICEEVDFVSFGTNDLTQYTLAVDRNNEDVQYLYDELHPAIFAQIEKVIDACNSKDVETSICGQAGSKKEMAEFLFKKGIKSISVNADAAFEISEIIKGLEDSFSREEELKGFSEKEEEEEIVEEEIEKVEEGKEGVAKAEKNIPLEIEEEIEARTEVPVREIIVEAKDHKWGKKAELGFESHPPVQEEKEEKEEEKIVEEEIEEGIEKSDSERDKGISNLKQDKESKLSEKPSETSKLEPVIDTKKTSGRDEKKDYKNSKRYQRYLRWKEKKRTWKKKKAEEKGKKKEEKKDGKEHITGIAPVDDLRSIDKDLKEVKKEVETERKKDLAERQMIEDRIEVEKEVVTDDKGVKDKIDEELEKKIKEVEEVEEQEKALENMREEDKTVFEEEVDLVEGSEDVKEQKDVYNEVKKEVKDEEMLEEISAETKINAVENEGKVSSDSREFEEVGVYNPDEENSSKSEKAKYSYNFDDWD